jgi:hypothetical protein
MSSNVRAKQVLSRAERSGQYDLISGYLFTSYYSALDYPFLNK